MSRTERPRQPDPLTLQAVNNTSIKTYGKRSLTLDLGLRRTFRWVFVIADIKRSIVGADFLRHFGLLVDMRHHRLSDVVTHLHIHGITCDTTSPSPSLLPRQPTSVYGNILAEFPFLTQPYTSEVPVKLEVTHHIETTGPPVAARVRRLGPERLLVARQEFDHMRELGIIRDTGAPPVAGHYLSTWSRRRPRETGAHVEITEHSTATPTLTGVRSLTSKTSPPHLQAQQSSPKLT